MCPILECTEISLQAQVVLSRNTFGVLTMQNKTDKNLDKETSINLALDNPKYCDRLGGNGNDNIAPSFQ